MKDEIELGFETIAWGPRMLLHKRVIPNQRAEFAMQLALTSRLNEYECCRFAETIFEEFEDRGWLTDVPGVKECQRLGEEARKEV